jgi:hypothetical protein
LLKTGSKSLFGLSEEELLALSSEELKELNAKVVFVRDAMPGAWLAYAEELMESAELIWREKDEGLRLEAEGARNGPQPGIRLTQRPRRISSISRPYILLAGFALENLIKGLLVAQDPTHINQGKLSSSLKSHELLRLASQVEGLCLSEQEKGVCRIVQDAIPYWGRYPIPLEYNGVLPEVAIDDEFRESFLELHFKLGKRLHLTIRDGWNSGVGPRHLKRRNARYGDEIVK